MTQTPVRRILLIDDDRGFGVLTTRRLGRARYAVSQALTGQEGIDQAARLSPDLILLDYHLPQTNGVAVCEQIRRTDPDLPIILLSSHITMELITSAVRAGVNDFVEKQKPAELLRLRIEAALRVRDLSDLARVRLDAAEFLTEASASFNAVLETEQIVLRAAAVAERFGPTHLVLLELPTDGEPQLHWVSERPPDRGGHEVLGVIEAARAAFGVNIEPGIRLGHISRQWPTENPTARFTALCAAGAANRLYVVMGVREDLSEAERHLFERFTNRLAMALENARLLKGIQVAHDELSEAFGALGRAQAERISAEKLAGIGQLAAGVAHEINNPLAFVISNLNVLQEYLRDISAVMRAFLDGDADGARALAERVDAGYLVDDLDPLIAETLEGGARVHEIVRKLRSFTRVQAGDAIEELSLSALLNDVVHLLQGELRGRLTVERTFESVPRIYADRGRLSQVFLHLVTHAQRSIPEGREGRLRLRLYQGEGEVAIAFEDNGRGIASDRLGRILEPFESTGEITEGGLDLAIADEITRRHGGRIEVESTPGEGSKFTVFLPARAARPPVPIGAELSAAESQRVGVALFVDDEQFLLNAYRRAFGRVFDVRTAQGGDAALALLEADHDIQVVVCDLAMPRVGGIEVYEWIRKHRPSLIKRFVAVIGGQPDARQRAFIADTGTRSISKPFEIKAVSELLSRLMHEIN